MEIKLIVQHNHARLWRNMRCIRNGLLCGLLISATPYAAAFGANYYVIDMREVAMLVKLESINQYNHIANGWVIIAEQIPNRLFGRPYDYTLDHEEYNCITNKVTIDFFANYNLSGSVINSQSVTHGWRPVIPNSNEEDIKKVICSGPTDHRLIVHVLNDAAVVTKFRLSKSH